jgi:membrane protein DedA with SNARE-associated domain
MPRDALAAFGFAVVAVVAGTWAGDWVSVAGGSVAGVGILVAVAIAKRQDREQAARAAELEAQWGRVLGRERRP